MDPQLYEEILDYKINGRYKSNWTKAQKTEIRRKALRYHVEGGSLYYKKGPGKETAFKVVSGADEANTIFSNYHSSPTGRHCGQKKTRDAITTHFYWPGMSIDIEKWVSECAVCQAAQRMLKKEVQYTPIKVTEPFELVGMDLIGNLQKTMNGYEYICVMVDYYTKWSQAYPLRSKQAEEVTDQIIKFVHQFEAPKRILTDQGSEFVNMINKGVCGKLGIQRSLCAPYHPQTNGLVEQMNGTIQKALCKLVGERPQTWDEYLDAVMFGLRTKKQMTTKYSPYFLMFGREARYPTEIPENYELDSTVEETVAKETVSPVGQGTAASTPAITSSAGQATVASTPAITQPVATAPAPTAAPSRSRKTRAAKIRASKALMAASTPAITSPAGQGIAASTPAVTSSIPSSSGAASGTYTEMEILKYVNEVWAGKLKTGHVILSKIGSYKLYCSDIARIAPQEELESEVINAYLTVIVKKHNRQNVDQAAVIDSFEMTRIWKKSSSKLKIDPMKYKLIMGIVNDHHHWMLMVIYPHEKKSIFLDPMGETKTKMANCQVATRVFMRKRGHNISRWTCSTLPHAHQRDGTSCGVFALKFAEGILNGKPITFDSRTKAVNTMRADIAATLLRESESLENLCHQCGSEETDDTKWIGCEQCTRRFHSGCLSSQPLDEDYICPVCL